MVKCPLLYFIFKDENELGRLMNALNIFPQEKYNCRQYYYNKKCQDYHFRKQMPRNITSHSFMDIIYLPITCQDYSIIHINKFQVYHTLDDTIQSMCKLAFSFPTI